MKVREYELLNDCVQRGVQMGWTRAHKHTDSPTQDHIQMSILDAVMLSVAEYFIFDGDQEEE